MAPARAAVKDSTSSICLEVSHLHPHLHQQLNRNLSPISTTTKPLSSSTISVTAANNRCTSFPDSENHLEKSECELISINLPCSYLPYLPSCEPYELVSRGTWIKPTGRKDESTTFGLKLYTKRFSPCQVDHEGGQHC